MLLGDRVRTSLGGLCTGFNTAGSVGGYTTLSGSTGSPVYLCPSNPGSGTVQACYSGIPGFNVQPPICSNTVSFNFNLPPSTRVVPYVRWAGEKQVLTKCFGSGL